MSHGNLEAVLRQYEQFSRDGGIVADIYAPDAEWMAAHDLISSAPRTSDVLTNDLLP